ncbi:MAG: trypsin-like peptidase domain-containing protein [Planctomycetes bacterium]|nr:trypsin-like peptidase domain-containing protein [Planctomycetota bacterium]
MKRFFFSLVAAVLFFSTSVNAQPLGEKPAIVKEMSVKELIHSVKGGIVRVEAFGQVVEPGTTLSDKEKEFTWASTGTGFIVEGGYIVTNYHVIRAKPGTTWKNRVLTGEFSFELPGTTPLTGTPQANINALRPLAGPANFESRNWSRRSAKLVVVGHDELCDLAVLKLMPTASTDLISKADNAIRTMRLDSYALKFAAPNAYELGDEVVAIGFAKAIHGMPSITKGLISGLNRSIDNHSDMIQTDAAINGGNSGGPLFNLKGEVIGVNTCTHKEAQNIGYARSSRTSAPLVARMIKDGSVARRNLGLTFDKLYRNETRNLRVANGLVVVQVAKDSPADKAGIKPGDIVIGLNSFEIESVGDFNAAIGLAEKSIKVAFQRLPANDAEKLVGYIRSGGTLPVRSTNGGENPAEMLKEIAAEISLK